MKISFLDKKIYILVFIIGIGGGILGLQKNRLNDTLNNNLEENPSKSMLMLQEQTLKSNLTLFNQFPDFGYENIVSNFIYLNFLQYFGDRGKRSVIGYTASSLFFENIVDRDPFFTYFYFLLSTSVSIYSGRPDISLALIDQGLQAMSPNTPPDSYYVWRYKAVDELLFLGDGEAARQSHLKAAEWANLSSDPNAKAVAQRSLNTAKFLAQDVNSQSAQIAAWAQVLAGAIDDETRQIAIERIEALGGTITVDQYGKVIVQHKANTDTTAPGNADAPTQN